MRTEKKQKIWCRYKALKIEYIFAELVIKMVGNDILKRLTLNFDTSKALKAPQMNITRRAKLPIIYNHNPWTGPSTFFPLRFESWPRTWRSRQGQGGGRDLLERSCQVLQTDQRVLLHNCVPLPAWSPCLDNTAPWRSTSTLSTTCTSSSWATATVPWCRSSWGRSG